MRIVLNADDFGASKDTLESTIACFEHGALTSATIMASADETGAALEYARAHPEHGFGVHLQLVGDGVERPVCDPSAIPTLVDGDGYLLATGLVRKRAMLRKLSTEQLQREIEAQIDVVVSGGIRVTHVDSHRHLHKVAQVREALARALPRFGIRRVRRVQDVFLRRPLKTPTYWVGPWWQRGIDRSFTTTTHFYMPSSAHDVAWAGAALDRLEELGGDTVEVGVHPGTVDEWRVDETASVERFAALARERGHALVSWRDV